MRWIIRLLALLVVLAVLAAGALLLVPSNKVAQLAERQFEAATGRAMTLSGSVRPTVWPRLGVRTGPVVIANASWSKAGPMLAAKGLEIGLDPMALIRGDIRISKVEVISPRILLERNSDGSGNWQFTPPEPAQKADASKKNKAAKAPEPQPGAGGLQAFSLDKGIVTDGSVTWVDHMTGQKIELSKIDATLAIPAFTGPAKLTMTAEANGAAMKLSGTLGAFADFMAGKVVQSDLTAAIGASTIGFKGKIGTDPVAAQGKLDAALKDPSALAAILGTAVPKLPQGLGRKLIAVKGDVTLASDGTMHLRGGNVELDGNKLQVAADVSFPGSRPKLNAQIKAGALDLAGLAQGGGGSGGGSAKAAASGWSTAPIDASGLNAANADISLDADSVNLGVARIGKTRALIRVENGRATVDLRQLSAYGGNLAGQVVANANGGLSVAADLNARGVAMRPLLTDLADYKRLDASADMSLKLTANGNSEAALARTLAGSGSFSFGKGELQGLDLLGMLRTLNLNYVGEGAKTIFDSIGASFRIDKGVLTNDDLALKAPLLTAAGKGTVNIGARTLNYTVTPTALTKADGTGGVKVPLNISGPWAKPKFGLDLNAITADKLDQAKQKLQDRAQQEISKQLGVAPDSGQNTQDAVRKKLEDEAKKGLLNLLKK